MISTTTSLSIASLRSNTGKIRQTFDRQANPIDRPAVDWNLVVLKIALRQSQYKILRHFLALRYDQSNSLC